MSLWNDVELRRLFLNKTPLIDVRAPIEFEAGIIPGSINIPILNNDERAQIGTCYKEKGQDEAIVLGHKLVQGSIKEERLNKWSQAIQSNPLTEVFCFRGGLRSQITCQWLSEKNIKRTPIKGGYKRMRQFFMSYLDEGPNAEYIRLGGVTGSGKTRLLPQIHSSLDLEEMAQHRGSAFGARGTQPSQVSFENALAMGLLTHEGNKILVEDESQMIGKRHIPKRQFELMRSSPLVILEVSSSDQAHNIFNDYVIGSEELFFQSGLEKIKQRLSKQVYTGISQGINQAFKSGFQFSDHEEWISLLLKNYYNPLYQKDLNRQKEKIVFTGDKLAVLDFLGQKLHKN
jgi:tRNA 2-selenouridine synthase